MSTNLKRECAISNETSIMNLIIIVVNGYFTVIETQRKW